MLKISSYYTCVPKSQSYDVRFLKYGARETEFFVILDNFFFPFTIPPNDPENQNFEKMKKMPGDIILSYIHVYHKWRSYDIWFLKCKVPQTFLSFWAIFCPFSPLTTWKIKILKLRKTPGHIILHICTINNNHMIYGSWDMEREGQNFLSFRKMFCPFTLQQSKKWK